MCVRFRTNTENWRADYGLFELGRIGGAKMKRGVSAPLFASIANSVLAVGRPDVDSSTIKRMN